MGASIGREGEVGRIARISKSVLVLGDIVVGSAVEANERTVIYGERAPNGLRGRVLEDKGQGDLRYVIQWKDGREELHDRQELTRLTYEEVMKDV